MWSSSTSPLSRDAPSDGVGVPQAIVDDRSLPLGASTPRAVDHDLAVGDRVGRYVIDGRLGEGGMGVVWRALDPEVGRRVALKFVRAAGGGGVDARLWSRLRREAQALARVRHPNVVALYDVGTTRRGSYLAMEHLDGVHLRRWLERGVRTWQEKVDVMCQIAEGLLAVHRAGLVHRDVKPTNLLVGRDGRVVLLDFGLALGVGEAETGRNGVDSEDVTMRTRMTRQNMVVGTTSYMSPEQLLGRDLDARSDQFAFCITLFEALFGQRPFPGKTPYELAVAFEAGVRPKIADRRDVPRHVCGAVMRGLRIDPAQRFANMVELVDALKPRHRWGRWALGVAGIGLGLGLGVAGAALGASLLGALAEPAQPAPRTASAQDDHSSPTPAVR
ncbi:MAG TPA: serine/threonine-protein kinase [Nannocystaceae bacterium]|nr:serine/threonine-protein kinase [Nannocystaceae bacterium]